MIPPSLPTSGVDPRISRRRDLENDVSGSSKPVDEIRMIDGVSGLRVDSRLDCIIRLRIRLRLQSLMERRGFEEDSFEFWFFEKDVPLSVTKIYVDEFMERIIRKKKGRWKSVYASVAPFANSHPTSSIRIVLNLSTLVFFSTRWNWSLRVAHIYVYLYFDPTRRALYT